MPVYGRQKFYWYKEPIAELNSDPPTEDVFETMLDTTRLTKVLFISVLRLDDDADAKNINVKTTIDGVVRTGTGWGQNNNTWNYWYLSPTVDEMYPSTSILNSASYKAIKGTSVKIEVETTEVPGANAELDGRVQYATWRPT